MEFTDSEYLWTEYYDIKISFSIGICHLKYENPYVTSPFKTVLYGTLLVILNTRLDPFPESGPLAFLSFELFEGVGSSSSVTSSILQSCKHFGSQCGHSDNHQYYMTKSLLNFKMIPVYDKNKVIAKVQDDSSTSSKNVSKTHKIWPPPNFHL